jgi:threo-3-hydroxy-L-aspartate ammonia-lyase
MILPTFNDVLSAAQLLNGVANMTPVLESRTLNERTGAQLFLKAENFQRIGAFKFRGAYNAIARLSDEEKSRGVLAYSSGNHAQAIALAGRLLGVKTTIVMPTDAPKVKLDATRGYGAEIISFDKNKQTREEIAASITGEAKGSSSAKRGSPILVPPFDHPHVIAGQGTAALELIAEVGELDTLVVCMGGGGLLSGCALAARAMLGNCQVIGVEPEAGNDGMKSLAAGHLIQFNNPDTIADGARTAPCERTFQLIQKHVDQITCVSDQELIATMHWLWQRMKIVVEPTGALALAAVLFGKVDVKNKRVGVIISGGNVDLIQAGKWFADLQKNS